MPSSVVHERIKEVQIYTRRMMTGTLIGDKTSVIKGGGLEFDQLREYQIGDDIRFIDWNSSARMSKVLVKQFYEERDRTIFIALDCSGSAFYGTNRLKYDAMAFVAGIIASACELAKDNIGLLLFSDSIEYYVPPRKGRKHLQVVLEKIFSQTPSNNKTNINCVLEHLAQLKKKNAIVFCISDFISPSYEKNIPVVAKMYDFIALTFHHAYEQQFPNVGLLTVRDIETGQEIIVDTRSKSMVHHFLKSHGQKQSELFKKYRIDMLSMTVDTAPVPALVQFFKSRKK